MVDTIKIWFLFIAFALVSCSDELDCTVVQLGGEGYIELSVGKHTEEHVVVSRAGGENPVFDDIYVIAMEERTEGGVTERYITHRYYFEHDGTSQLVNSQRANSSNPNACWDRSDNTLSRLKVRSGNCYIMVLTNVKHHPSVVTLEQLESYTRESELKNIDVDPAALDEAHPLLAGYYIANYTGGAVINPVGSDPIVVNPDSPVVPTGKIVLLSPFSQTDVTITSRDNRFTLLSYQLVNIPTCTTLFNSDAGWERYASASPLPLATGSEVETFTKTIASGGAVSYGISFNSVERKNMAMCEAYALETDTVSNRSNYIRYTADVPGKSVLHPTYVKVKGVFNDGVFIKGCTFYLALGDFKNDATSRELDVIRHRHYKYHIHVKNVNEIETYVADFPSIVYFQFSTPEGTAQTFTISPVPTGMEYKVGEKGWKSMPADGTVTFGGSEDVLRLRNRMAQGTVWGSNVATISFADATVPVKCSGDLRTIVDWYAVGIGQEVDWNNVSFKQLFKGNTALTDAYDLQFPAPISYASTLREETYREMFIDCVNLQRAPQQLPAERGANRCYQRMFYNCTSLVNAPTIGMKIFGTFACSEMFMNCKSLTQVQDVWDGIKPNTAGLQRTFAGCTSLKKALTGLVLDAKSDMSDMFMDGTFQDCTLLEQVFDNLAPTHIRSNTYNKTFMNCKSLTKAPTIDAMYFMDPNNFNSMQQMFLGCENLVTPPDELKIVSPLRGTYREMFKGCKNLTQAPIISAQNVPGTIEFYHRNETTPTFVELPKPQFEDKGELKDNANYAFYRMFYDSGVKEFRLSAPNMIVEPTTEYAEMNRVEPEVGREPWRAIYQKFDVTTTVNTYRTPNGVVKVKTQAIKEAFEANGCAPAGWTVEVY